MKEPVFIGNKQTFFNKVWGFVREGTVAGGDLNSCVIHKPTDERGNAFFSFEGRRYLVRRAVYVVYKGEIPEGHKIVNTCGDVRCINNRHLKTEPL